MDSHALESAVVSMPLSPNLERARIKVRERERERARERDRVREKG